MTTTTSRNKVELKAFDGMKTQESMLTKTKASENTKIKEEISMLMVNRNLNSLESQCIVVSGNEEEGE